MSYCPRVPGYLLSRKELLERAISSKREKEARYRRECEANCRYFNDLQTEAVKHDSWTSEEMCRVREAHRIKMEKENKKRILNERRMKLAALLNEEKEQLERELKELSERRYKCVEKHTENGKRPRVTVENGEEKQLQELYRDWIQSKQDEVVNGQNAAIEDVEIEKLRLDEDENLVDKQKQSEDVIMRHISELKTKENEANRLRVELEMLQQKQWRLEEIEEEKREQINKQNKKMQTAKCLKHQLKVHLQARAREIVKQLEDEWEMMRHALHETELERRQNDLRREKNRKEAERFREIIEEQIEEEKKRQMELDTLFNEEAGKVLKQREEQWKHERRCRHNVMSELMDGLRKETEEKMAENLKRQEESVKAREDLLRMIEEEKEKMLKNQKKREQMQFQNGHCEEDY